MAKFRFRLETLLRMRIADRDQCRAQLAEVLEAEQRLKDQIDEIQTDMKSQNDWTRERLGTGQLNIDLLTAGQRELIHLKTLQQDKIALMQQLIPHIQQRRQALVDADHAVKTLEKLKESRAEEHAQHEMRIESRQMDEIAIHNFTRDGA